MAKKTHSQVEAQRLAERISAFEGVTEVFWFQPTEKLTEFYIAINSRRDAEKKHKEIQKIAEENDEANFYALPRECFHWGYAGTKQ